MHYKNGYAIADRSNSGDRAGDSRSVKPWSYVEQQIPNLKGLEKYFPYREITEDEKRYEEILKSTKDTYIRGGNLQGYIEDEIRGLVINGSQVTDVDFIRDYAALGVKISDNQIKSLRPEVVNSLIESGYFLTQGPNQTNILNPKQQLRVVRIKIQNKIELTGDDLLLLPEKEINDYTSNLNSHDTRNLLKYSKEPNKVINILLSNKEFISKSSNVYDLLENVLDPEKVINILLSKKEFISNLDSSGITHLLRFSEDPEKVVNVLGDRAKQFISNLGSSGIDRLLAFNKNNQKIKEELINILLSNKEFVSNLDSSAIEKFGMYSEERDKVFDVLFSNKEFMSNLDLSNLDLYTKKQLLRNSKYTEKFIYRLLRDEEYLTYLEDGEDAEIETILLNSENPDKVLNMLGDKKDDVIDRLNNSKKIYKKIEAFISNSKAPDKLLQLFDLKDEYLEDMGRYDFMKILEKTKVPYKVIDALGDKGKQFISNLDSKGIQDLLTYSKKPEKVINALGDKGKQFMSNLDSKGIRFLLALSKNFEKTKQILKKYGHDV
jgi:predicted nucleic-acid-binding protein